MRHCCHRQISCCYCCVLNSYSRFRSLQSHIGLCVIVCFCLVQADCSVPCLSVLQHCVTTHCCVSVCLSVSQIILFASAHIIFCCLDQSLPLLTKKLIITRHDGMLPSPSLWLPATFTCLRSWPTYFQFVHQNCQNMAADYFFVGD